MMSMMKLNLLSDVAVSPNLNDSTQPPTCSYPFTTVMNDGTVVMVYRGGAEKHTYDGILFSQRSSDGGQTWSAPVVVCDFTTQNPPQPVTTGGICQVHDGSLLLIFKTTRVTQPNHFVYSAEGLTQQCILYVAQSWDAGQTWSLPRQIDVNGYSVFGITTSPMVLPSGKIFLPLEARLAGKVTTTLGQFVSTVEEIDGNFRDLGLSDPANLLEHCDVRFAIMDDQVLALLWTFRKDNERTIELHRSVSDDEGQTWSPPSPLPFIGQITAPLALNTGTIIAASNYRLDPPGIRLWHSDDGGLTWQDPPVQMWDPAQSRTIAEPLEAVGTGGNDDGVWLHMDDFTFGTPNLHRLPDGVILLTYYATLNDTNHIRACRFAIQGDL